MIQVYVLNIAANPHPSGIYPSLLKNSSRYLVKARASDYTKITSPRDESDGIYSGRILLWTEINIEGPWLDLGMEDDLPSELKKEINIPDNAKPNYRTFNYVFVEKSHFLYFEGLNEFGERLGATTAKRIFTQLFSQDILGPDGPEVEVTVVPDENAVAEVLGLPGLRNLVIRVVLPNPDGASPAKQRVFEEMTATKARLAEEHYVKSKDAERLIPTQRMKDWAEVGAESGFVRGEGRRPNGTRIEAATDKYPKRYYIDQEFGDTFVKRLMATVRLLG